MLYRSEQQPQPQQPQPPQQQPATMPQLQQEIFVPYGQVNIINDFRALWGDIVTWVRQYISAIAAGYPNVYATQDRLSRIPIHFQDRLKMIFGAQSAEIFQRLLSMHIIYTERIIEAMKVGDTETINTSTVALYNNADEMAAYLRQINPFWNETQWRNLLYNFIAMNLQETVAFMSGDYVKDIDIYDRLIYHSQLVGDYMANGIIQYLVVSRPIA